ncbi:DoxX family protein [Paraburkholderia caballeronis]|nr:DoxX family membrane protein [Paraburkholderia caballeronis]
MTAARAAARPDYRAADFGLLWLRVAASLLILAVHGVPKVLHFHAQLAVIEDPFHLGRWSSLLFAIFAEALCPWFVIAGVAARAAAVPLLVVTLIALAMVHRAWSLEEGQFAWMLLILYGTVVIAGPGQIRLRGARARRSQP